MKSKSLRWLLVALLVIGIALTVLYRDRLDVAALQQWVQQAGTAGPLLFMLIYAIGTLFFLPGSVLTLAGGALFGPVWGTLWNLTGATLGGALAFVAARYLGAEWVERRAGPKLKRLTDGVAAEGWRFVAFVRLVPLFPFNLLNYALGLTRIAFMPYLLATWVFMLPGALAYTYLGYAGREAMAGGEGLIQKGLLALALLAVVAFLPRLIAKLRERPMLEVGELKQRLDAGENLLVLDVRTAADFVGEQGHLAAARNLPLEELPAHVEEMEPWMEKTVALVCRTDRRSAKAAAILAGAGFSDVHVVRGGMTAWLTNDWPVEEVQLTEEC
ncbi:MAG: VTT domain-containing protein [Chromatiaceae bacterium]|nr:VTT domain-containing protein [Chromatiaceae bacterium]